jgi:hypothetical protein
MLILKQKICKYDDCCKKALPNRRICYFHYLYEQRKKREDKLAKQAVSKTKAKVRHEQSIEGKRELMRKAWKLQSRAVRMAAADENGMVRCYTFDEEHKEEKIPWQEAQLGHFRHDQLDFDLDRNLRIQCTRCNKWNHGELDIYSANLVKEGIDIVKLELDANTFGNGYDIKTLKEIISKYEKNRVERKIRRSILIH